MPDIPPWAANLGLYIVVGMFIVFGAPTIAWLGKREIQRWEEERENHREQIRDLKQEVRLLKRQLAQRMEEQHVGVEKKVEQVLEEVRS